MPWKLHVSEQTTVLRRIKIHQRLFTKGKVQKCINQPHTYWLVWFLQFSGRKKGTNRLYVENIGSGFSANAFITRYLVNSNCNNTNVCQVLTLRGTLLGLRTLSFLINSLNLICCIGLVVIMHLKEVLANSCCDKRQPFVLVWGWTACICIWADFFV